MTEQPRAASPEGAGAAPGGSTQGGQATEGIVIRDRRRVNPAGGSADAATGTDGTGAAEHTAVPGTASGDSADQPGTADRPTAEEAEKVATEPVTTDEPTGTSQTGVLEDGVPVGAEPTESTEPAQVGPVADEEIAEVLAAQTPTGPEGPGVDAPAEPVEPVEPAPTEVPGACGAELEALRAERAERTRDLQRISAEYANYRKRVDRDRGLMAEQATGAVLVALLPILDDLDRAREHGDLVGPFGTVAEQLVTALGKFGLTPFGESGDPFDPTRHEAVAHQTSADVTESTCVTVMRRGYQLGDRLLRPALVGVADPE